MRSTAATRDDTNLIESILHPVRASSFNLSSLLLMCSLIVPVIYEMKSSRSWFLIDEVEANIYLFDFARAKCRSDGAADIFPFLIFQNEDHFTENGDFWATETL